MTDPPSATDKTSRTDTAELAVAVGRLRDAAALLHEGAPERANADAQLGVALAAWVLADPGADAAGATGGRVDEAIQLLAKAQQEISPGDDYPVVVRYWLAMASALRFMWWSGSEADAERALLEFEAVLAMAGLDQQAADLCHIFSACLHLFRSAPATLRSTSASIGPDQVRQMLVSQSARPSQDAARLALDHLDRVSGPDAQGAGYAHIELWLRGVANIALGSGGRGGNVEVSVKAFEEALRLTPSDHLAVGELQGMLGLLYGVQAMRGEAGAQDASERSLDALTAAASQLGDAHPMLPVMRGMLGGAAGIPLGGRLPSREESAAAAELLEAFMDGMPDDHPARAEALLRLGALLISQAFHLDGSLPQLRKLSHQLEEMISRPATSQLNHAVNLFLLGMTEGIDGLLGPDAELLNKAVDRLKSAADAAPAGHQVTRFARLGLMCVLGQRFAQAGEMQYLDAAMHYAGQIAKSTETDEVSDPLLFAAHHLLLSAPLARNPDLVSHERVAKMITQMEALGARLPKGHPLRQSMDTDLHAMRVVQGGLTAEWHGSGPTAADPALVTRAADDAVATAKATPPDDPFYALNLGAAGSARGMQGVLLHDRRILCEGIALLAEACAATTVSDHRRRLLTMLGCALHMRYSMTHDRADLRNAISRLEEARRLADEDHGGAGLADILYMTALGYCERNDRNLRDLQRGTQLGLSALRERSTTVLLQSSVDRAFDAAAAATGEAADVARWCLADQNLEAAVEALERGRGIVLHAATADADVPVLLREASRAELASEWEGAWDAARQAGPDPWDSLTGISAPLRPRSGPAGGWQHEPEVRVPSDLRYRVVRALEGTELERLLAPPPVSEITQALRNVGAQALVYLLPRDGRAPGLALIVHAGGNIQGIGLLQLTADPGSPVAEFARAQHDRYGSASPTDETHAGWRRGLDDLCDWAWQAAMSRVLGSVTGDGGRRPRLVLVPVGDLGVVPWHAARRTVTGGEVRYACQDAVISYAASARQFTEACRNGRRPWDATPAMVGPPAQDLYFAKKEVDLIHRLYYPNGTLLGNGDRRSATATAENVLALLPRAGVGGVTLLHLGCHAIPARRPVDGRLLFAAEETLSMRDILGQARARPRDSPGCLVVLAACGSDLSGGHHDEALTLATTFLAAGAAGAVGTRWPVDDVATMVFMAVFHHYLNSGYDDPATALRAAQAWMLNPARRFPADFPSTVPKMAGTRDLTMPEHWAAFTYHGQ